jgi:RNA polymerase sigma-70 factor (ECF subfamily)
MADLPPFERVYRDHRDRIYRLVLKLTTHPLDAEDLTQQVFTRAMGAYTTFRQESDVATWLHRIAMNLCVNYIRDRVRHRRVEGPSIDDGGPNERPLADTLPERRPGPPSLMERDDVSRRLRAALSEMDEIHRDVLVLREFEGLSYEEIARVLDIHVDAVGVRLLRARNQLKQMMKNDL